MTDEERTYLDEFWSDLHALKHHQYALARDEYGLDLTLTELGPARARQFADVVGEKSGYRHVFRCPVRNGKPIGEWERVDVEEGQ